MTETTGGSDVGRSQTRAVEENGAWRLYGRTWFTSAPTTSQMRAISFMNEMRVASMALAAYLVISADGGSMNRIGLPVRT